MHLTQLLRTFKSEDLKSIHHVSYWIGECCDEFMSGLSANVPQCNVHANIVPPYFQSWAELLCDARIADVISSSNWKTLINRNAYQYHVSRFPVLKIEQEVGYSLESVWKKLSSPAIDGKTREIMYFLIHNKLPTRERLFRFFSVNDPYCLLCIESDGPIIDDREHYFCKCLKVKEVWQAFKELLVEISDGELSGCMNFDLLTLRVPKLRNGCDDELVWLISTYVNEIWAQCHENESSSVSKEKIFGFLRFKYRKYKFGSRPRLSISALNIA